jgi:hypothetical protein
MLPAQTLPPTNPLRGPAVPRFSDLVAWDLLTVTPTAEGVRRDVFDSPTDTADKMRCPITTLNPSEKSGEQSKYLPEEVITAKEGTLEAHWDGQSKTGRPGSVIFFAAGPTTFLRNAGPTPCT